MPPTDAQDRLFQIAEETIDLPNKKAWQEITTRLKAGRVLGLCDARDYVWQIRRTMLDLAQAAS